MYIIQKLSKRWKIALSETMVRKMEKQLQTKNLPNAIFEFQAMSSVKIVIVGIQSANLFWSFASEGVEFWLANYGKDSLAGDSFFRQSRFDAYAEFSRLCFSPIIITVRNPSQSMDLPRYFFINFTCFAGIV